MNKNLLKTLFKLTLAVLLIYWLVDSGKLDFAILGDVLNHPARLLIAFALTIFNLLLVTYRWKSILEFKTSEKLSFSKVAKFNWIGLFFNAVLPGSVSGDIVKIFYVKELDSNLSKRFLLASVVIDRIIGLIGLVLLLGLFSLYNYTNLISLSHNVKTLIDINLILLLLVIIGLIGLFKFQKFPYRFVRLFSFNKLIQKVYKNILVLWDNLCGMKRKLIRLILLSLFVQANAVIIFWVAASPFAGPNFEFIYAFSFIPLGFIAIAIPIAPSGLGVGHAVFHELFTYFQVDNGASLFNIYFFITLFGNILGAIPYLLTQKKSLKEINSEMEEV